MSITFLATLYKLLSISGISASGQGCPAYGTYLGESCTTAQATDASGAVHTVGVRQYVFANGSCGEIYQVEQPQFGVCDFPPYGWAYGYYPNYVWVGDIYWSHPSNPQYGQLAHSGQNYVVNYGIDFYTTYPDYYSTGATVLYDGSQIGNDINGVDGWRLRIFFQFDGTTYTTIEDDLTPDTEPDPNPTE